MPRLSHPHLLYMKKYARIFRYIGGYKKEVFLYFLFIILSIVFSIISLGMLMPFLELIFYGSESGSSDVLKQSSNPVVATIRNFLLTSFKTGDGVNNKIEMLGLICVLIIVSILLKNLFLYLIILYFKSAKK